jgi:hypothetical protein
MMKKSILFFLLSISCAPLFAQADRSSEVYQIIKSKDSLLFDMGFNRCDIRQFENLLSDNFEFYHDKAGITASKTEFISGIRDRICKLDYKPRRELIASSLEVHPLYRNDTLYGALQLGKHRFYALGKDGSEHITSTALFTHFWLLQQGQWKLSRGYSYDHRNSN